MVMALTIVYGFSMMQSIQFMLHVHPNISRTHLRNCAWPLTLGYGVAAFLSPLAGGYLVDLYKTFYWTMSITALVLGASIAPLIVMQRNITID